MPPRDPASLDVSPAHRQVLQSLLRAWVPLAEVWAYGSRVTGGAHEGSDLDLVLRDLPDPVRELAAVSALKAALQDSLLPMLVEVHPWAQLPEAFHRNIEAAYVVLQAGQSS